MIPKSIPKKASVALAITTTAALIGFSSSELLSKFKTHHTSASISLPSSQASRTLKGHSVWVYAIAISRDGRTLASASGDETIKLWPVSHDLSSKAKTQTLENTLPGSGKVYVKQPDERT